MSDREAGRKKDADTASLLEIAEVAERSAKKEQQRQIDHDEIVRSIAEGDLPTVEKKVAFLLNHYQNTRDSDVALMLRYWEEFEKDYDGGDISREDLFKFERLTTISRARARVQNDLKLYQGTEEVRRRRKQLAADVREQKPTVPDLPTTIVYTDESGKNETHLVVGSVWFARPMSVVELTKATRDWRDGRKFHREFHFKQCDDRNLDHYRSYVDLLLEHSEAMAFKVMTVERAGHRDVQEALGNLFFFLLTSGLQHELDTHRIALPRVLQVWKDKENEGPDKLLLAKVAERLQLAIPGQFAGQLYLHRFEAVDSKGTGPIQIADLMTSSVARLMNFPDRNEPKDKLARYFLGTFGYRDIGQPGGDNCVRLQF